MAHFFLIISIPIHFLFMFPRNQENYKKFIEINFINININSVMSHTGLINTEGLHFSKTTTCNNTAS